MNAISLGLVNGLGFFAVFYALGLRHHMGALLLVSAGAALALGLVVYFGGRHAK